MQKSQKNTSQFVLNFAKIYRMKYLFMFVTLLWGYSSQGADIPQSEGFINDFTETLSVEEHQELETLVQDYYRKTGIQIGLALEGRLNGKDPFDRAMELSRTWGVGAAGDKRGILIYIAQKERKYFITTAQKIQADITDGIAGELARNYLVPELKTDQYYSGVKALIEALMREIQSDDLKTKISQAWYLKDPFYPQTGLGKSVLTLVILLFLVNIYFGLGKNLRSRFILNKRASELGIEIKPWNTPKKS